VQQMVRPVQRRVLVHTHQAPGGQCCQLCQPHSTKLPIIDSSAMCSACADSLRL